jgi:hypothetical protein
VASANRDRGLLQDRVRERVTEATRRKLDATVGGADKGVGTERVRRRVLNDGHGTTKI